MRTDVNPAGSGIVGQDRRAVLSTLWIVVLLNVIFRDIHELFRPEFLAEMMTGTVNGVEMTEEFLLLAAVALEIPIAMVILTRVLPHRTNRWANVTAAAITAAAIVVNRPGDLDDFFFATMKLFALAAIAIIAWRWPKPEQTVAEHA